MCLNKPRLQQWSVRPLSLKLRQGGMLQGDAFKCICSCGVLSCANSSVASRSCQWVGGWKTGRQNWWPWCARSLGQLLTTCPHLLGWEMARAVGNAFC